MGRRRSWKDYYNDNEPYVAQWLRNLVDAKLIPRGDVDEKEIQRVRPRDVAGYRRCHFFAGIAGWSIALELAGWPEGKEAWTGSCPCQPFSCAGKRKGTKDERHLWPFWYELIKKCRPKVIFGEQVASAGAVGKIKKTGKGIWQKVSQEASCKRFDTTRQEAFGEEGLCVRSFGSFGRDSGSNRSGLLRNNRSSVQFGWGSYLGQPVIGSDRSEAGVCLRQHSGGVSWDKHGDGRMGREHGRKNGACDHEYTKGKIERVIFAIGKDIAGELDWPWFSRVQADLERAGYTVGACVLPAAGVGAPHIRQRLWWVADTHGSERWKKAKRWQHEPHGQDARWKEETGGHRVRSAINCERLADSQDTDRGSAADMEDTGWRAPEARGCSGDGGRGSRQDLPETSGTGCDGRLGNAECNGREQGTKEVCRRESEPAEPGEDGGLGHAEQSGLEGCGTGVRGGPGHGAGGEQASPTGFWDDFELVPCFDGKARRVGTGIQPLAHGVPCRVGKLRAYGNSIVPQIAAVFVRAYMKVRGI